MLDSSAVLATGLTTSMLMFCMVFLVLFVFILFFVGVMVYYFTGTKPGGHLLHMFMRVAARTYAQVWMLFAVFLKLFGLYSILKAILGAVFPDFVYGRAASSMQINDLQVGIILVMFAAIVFSVHWGLAYIIETKAERKGTFITKLFTGTGLVISAAIFFGSLLMLILQVLTYVQQSSGATVSSRPGNTLALLLATLPIWVYYVMNTLTIVRHEARAKK